MTGQVESGGLKPGDRDALLHGTPDGATFKMADVRILPARTWVDTGFDGIEMYLDADESTRLLLRRVDPGWER